MSDQNNVAEKPDTGETKEDVLSQEFGAVTVVDGVFRRFSALEKVPADAPVVIIEDDLDDMTREQMEDMYGRVTGQGKKTFKTKSVAKENLVYAVKKYLKINDEVPVETLPEEPAGKPARQPKAPRAGSNNTYKLLPVTAKTADLLKQFSPQAKVCVQLLVDAAKEVGKDEVPETVLKEYVAKHSEPLKTKQDPWRVFQYYRSTMIAADVLRVE